MMEILLEIILGLHIAILLYCAFFIMRKHFSGMPYMQNEEKPFVSILVAARNEEENILNCLQSLSKLNYPNHKYEVLAGNDNSEDKTAFIVSEYIKNKNNFKLINIKENIGQARGKANVLAQLAQEAKGEYFFVTDADMQLPENWIQSHLKHFSGDVYMTSGTTLTKAGNSIFSKMQNMEWLYLMGLFHTIDTIKPVTAMGNNMAFSAEKYYQTGGYENLPFSVTEDILLMQEFQKLGYLHKHILSAENLSCQNPLNAISDLLKQRKRWFQGGKKQPFYIWLLFLIYAAFLPVLIILFFYNWQISIYILAGKCFTDAFFLHQTAKRLHVKITFSLLPFFEIYQFILNPLILFYSFFGGKVTWKKRKY